MSAINTLIGNPLFIILQQVFAGRKVTRDYQHIDQYNDADQKAGIVTMILSAPRAAISDNLHPVRVMLTFQGVVSEASGGSAIEELELSFIDQVQQFVASVSGIGIELVEWKNSRQLEHPWAWCGAVLELAPVDLSADSVNANLSPFITFNADYNLPPTGDDNDATDTVTLEQ
ncbi:MAG: hypothetical protein OEZ10_11515 [Gammaproteobacteria bacterium]|nr:hypothetical protein [Gammaproteobacteria bacterium]